jgi:hypothetical protein
MSAHGCISMPCWLCHPELAPDYARTPARYEPEPFNPGAWMFMPTLSNLLPSGDYGIGTERMAMWLLDTLSEPHSES